MNRLRCLLTTLVLAGLWSPFTPRLVAAESVKPLRVLLIAGGCCHDYARQKDLLKDGLEARANVEVDVVYTDDRSTRARFEIYENPDWANGYDVIVHDECSAEVKDLPYVNNILDAHKSVPAVNLHCAMHSYRVEGDAWFEFVGIQSTSHGPQDPIAIHFGQREHPVTTILPDWTTGREELYNNVKIFPGATPLAWGKQEVGPADNRRVVEAVVAWANDYHGTRVFSTTLGHNNETVGDDRYLNLVTRGLLWAADRLDDDYLKTAGGPITRPLNLAKGATATASSEEANRDNFANKAFDGSSASRWCASGPGENEWLQVDLGEPRRVTATRIDWESGDVPYRYRIEGSQDGEEWKLLVNASGNEERGPNEDTFLADGVRHLRVTYLGKPGGGWASIWEFEVFGEEVEVIDPGQARREEELAKLGDTQVPEGFDATVFAAPPMVNYPVYVAAEPDGTLYVSSDGNGSLDRNPNRGRVVRLKDLDGDGRADESKEFIKDVDSPRGLIWDHDRLYLMHPPHLSAFIDHDGDGVADEQQILVKNIAFGFEDRPADHTSNGLALGVDGWIYCAIGDFGFMEAEGTDGRKLQLRGGGVVRVRPDGTGLELFAEGTRNILEVAVSPLLDVFARDNTNDGDGWDVRFHHFAGLGHHGYPSLYKNFADETIAPLSDYGGGSGCGAAWIDEPGIPAQWNNAPFTADWGTGWVYRHDVNARGATFTDEQQTFFKATRPTDLDVDANSAVYLASWKGATFTWAGPEVGYITRLAPRGYSPSPVPKFETLTDSELVALLENPSHRTRLEAQRTLLRREATNATVAELKRLARDSNATKASRVISIFTLKQALGANATDTLTSLAADPGVSAWAIRALTDHLGELADVAAEPLLVGLRSEDARTRREAVMALARLGRSEHAGALVPLLADSEPVIVHTAVEAMTSLGATATAFEVVDSREAGSAEREGALRVVQALHRPEVVDGLLARLEGERDVNRRRGLIRALGRLHFREGEWAGESWGTRPDTSGPYYKTVEWAESKRILNALNTALAAASGEQAAFTIETMDRHKIRSAAITDKVLELASANAEYLPSAVTQLARANELPAKAKPMLREVAARVDVSADVRAQAAVALSGHDLPSSLDAVVAALSGLSNEDEQSSANRAARNAFLNSPGLDDVHAQLVGMSEDGGSSALFANAGLLKLTDAKGVAREVAEAARARIDAAWSQSDGRRQVLEAVRWAGHRAYKDRVVEASEDPNTAVAEAARETARALRIDLAKEKAELATRKPIGEQSADEVVAAVLNAKGEIELGRQLFTQQACVTCHTVAPDEELRGPFLGNIATTYSREELAWNILDPDRSIAQGFVGHHFVLKDELEHDGFVTREAADEVVIRNVAAQEIVIPVSEIVRREELKRSLMPAGLVDNLSVAEFASMLDYLEALAKGE